MFFSGIIMEKDTAREEDEELMKQVEEKGSEWSSSGEEKSEERREKEKHGSTSGEKMSKNEEKEKEGSTSGEKTSAGKKKYVRAKHKCPFPSCKTLVYHLPRHMRLTHGWSKEDALNVVSKFGLRKDRSKKEKFKKPRKSLICPYPKCQAVVKRIHNHLVEVHKATRGSDKYKRMLAVTTEHVPIVISSDSDDSSNYDGSLSKVQQKVKRKRSVIQSVFKRVYPSDEEATSTFRKNKKKKENAKKHPSIFRKETDDENDDESVFERAYASDEEQTSTFRKNKKKKENAKIHPSIFRKETDDENDDESVFERSYASDEEETSTFRKNIKKKEHAEEHPSIFRKETDDENDDESDSDSEYNGEGDDDSEYNDEGDGNKHDKDIQYTPIQMPEQDLPSYSNMKDVAKNITSSESSVSDLSVSEVEFIPDDTNYLTDMDSVSPSIFSRFETWLRGPDGGRKDEHCAQQCARQVQLIVETIDPKSAELNNLFDKTVLRDKWLVVFEKDRQPGTLKAYLGALHRFYAFLKCEQIDLPGVKNASRILDSMCEQMKMWIKSYSKLVKRRFWVKRLEDISNLRTPEQIKQFDSSDVARRAIKIIGEFQESNEQVLPSQSQYTTVRDYLLTILCINNGSRSGALANMTMEEFRAAQRDGDEYLVRVKNHKTFDSHGPAPVVFSQSIYKWMEVFIGRMRNRLADVDTTNTAPVFLSWNQKKMHSSHVGVQIDSCWGKEFGKDAASGGATAFRKAVVSAVQECNHEIREDLATLMVHNKATADRYYLLKSKEKSALNASRQVAKIMHASCPVDGDSSNISRHKWTLEEEDVVKKLFAEQINSCSISLDIVRKIAQKDPVLCNLPPLVIRNKIRYLFGETESLGLPTEVESPEQRFTRLGLRNRKDQITVPDVADCNQRQDEENSGSEYTPSVIAPSSTAYSKRKSPLMNEDEFAKFHALFKDLINNKMPIKRNFVQSQIENNPGLKHLLDKCTIIQLADKVRTERKFAERS